LPGTAKPQNELNKGSHATPLRQSAISHLSVAPTAFETLTSLTKSTSKPLCSVNDGQKTMAATSNASALATSNGTVANIQPPRDLYGGRSVMQQRTTSPTMTSPKTGKRHGESAGPQESLTVSVLRRRKRVSERGAIRVGEREQLSSQNHHHHHNLADSRNKDQAISATAINATSLITAQKIALKLNKMRTKVL
jgi:hypothetical protein